MIKMVKKENKETGFALSKENYKLMAIGFAIIVVGFILMAGGGSDDPNVFNPNIGFAFEIYAIMKKPKTNS